MIRSMLSRSSALRSIAGSTRLFSSTTVTKDLARVTLIGRLGADPEKATSANGRDYARYSVAVRQGRDTEPSWYHVVCFDQHLDYLLNNFAKGNLIYVDATASLQPFETADGRRVGSLQLVQRTIQRLSAPRRDQQLENAEAEVEGEN
ncbi:hypothetical protein V1525DRAFT_399932 [Lipomyces kononenkoae]|uniref:Uncharacterized protein n=1 Tax=Lipomyces kononenkoae TaxID=34357 RepID=A0ACC3T5K8_LIPKO